MNIDSSDEEEEHVTRIFYHRKSSCRTFNSFDFPQSRKRIKKKTNQSKNVRCQYFNRLLKLPFMKKKKQITSVKLHIKTECPTVFTDKTPDEPEENLTPNLNIIGPICLQCKTKKREICFEDCGHIITCVSCANLLTKCPICQTPISEKIKIFLC